MMLIPDLLTALQPVTIETLQEIPIILIFLHFQHPFFKQFNEVKLTLFVAIQLVVHHYEVVLFRIEGELLFDFARDRFQTLFDYCFCLGSEFVFQSLHFDSDDLLELVLIVLFGIEVISLPLMVISLPIGHLDPIVS